MKILVAVDLSPAAQPVLEQARLLATAFRAQIWLLHVAEPDPAFVGFEADSKVMRDLTAEHFHDEHRGLQAMADQLRQAGLDCTALLIQGATVETILQEAQRLGVDMIVTGSHGKGKMQRLLLGSVSEGLLHESTVPVHLVPTRDITT